MFKAHYRLHLIAIALLLSVMALSPLFRGDVTGVPSQAAAKPTIKQVAATALHFEANRGQADSRVRYLAHGAGYTMYITDSAAWLALSRLPRNAEGKIDPQAAIQMTTLRFQLLGANSAPLVAENQLAATSNYLNGRDAAKWVTDVPNFARVSYQNAYPGIDLSYYGKGSQLEYDFRVAPGADVTSIRLQIEAAEGIGMQGSDLVLHTALGDVRQPAPFIYQDTASGRQQVAGSYKLLGDNTVGFSVASYDHTQPLVIDPILYSTYLGGSDVDDANALAIDPAGNAYITGVTLSAFDFPLLNPIQSTEGGNYDAFVSKFNAQGQLVYSTFLGGQGIEQGLGIAADSAGNAYITGQTNAAVGFPIVNASQPTNAGGYDAFVSKINAAGNAFVYSTYLGGGAEDDGIGIAVDGDGNAYVTGMTESGNFPTLNPFQATYAGGTSGGDAFVTKFSATGARVYSTYLGGSGSENYFGGGIYYGGIAVDSGGNAYVTGGTDATNFPTLNPLQPANAGGVADAFVTKLNSSGNALIFSTYFGGSVGGSSIGDDYGTGIDVDASGNAYVVGRTNSTNITRTNLATAGGGYDGFVSKFSSDGATVLYSRYLGGVNNDIAAAIAVDGEGHAYVTGRAGSLPAGPSFPLVHPDQPGFGGGDYDAFVSKVSVAGTTLDYSTFLGGSGNEYGGGIRVSAAGEVYVAGGTGSADFPTVSAYQGNNAGGSDAFVSHYALPTPTDCANPFTDLNGNVFYPAIHALYCRGVVNGTGASTFGPAGTSTRAQFAKVVTLGFGILLITPSDGQNFTDVSPSNFAYTYIESGYRVGVLSGYDQATCASIGATYPCYGPNRPITRAQLTKLVVSAAGYNLINPPTPTFSDVGSSNVFYRYIETAAAKGVVNGTGGGHFSPNVNIRRDQMCQIVYKGITTP